MWTGGRGGLVSSAISKDRHASDTYAGNVTWFGDLVGSATAGNGLGDGGGHDMVQSTCA